MRINAAILTYNRPESLLHCLNSIELSLSKCKHPIHLHVFVLFNGSLENPPPHRWNFQIEYHHSQTKWPLGGARNFLLQTMDLDNTVGVLFFDDDVLLPEVYFGNLVDILSGPNTADFIGGPNLGWKNEKTSRFESNSDALLSSRLVTGPFSKRYHKASTSKATSWSLILCNLFVSSEFLKKIQFSFALESGEENDFIERLIKVGAQGQYMPELFVFHKRRTHLTSLIQQMWRYGKGRAQHLSTDRVLGPILASLLFLGIAALVTFLSISYPIYLLSVLLTYSILVVGVSIFTTSFLGWPLAVLQVIAIHFSYLSGLFFHIVPKPFFNLKMSLRIFFSMLTPRRMGVLTYKALFSIAKALSLASHAKGNLICIHYRNSLVSGKIHFLKSDIDSTVVYSSKHLQKPPRLRLLELLGEVFYVPDDELEVNLCLANLHTLRRDPGIIDCAKDLKVPVQKILSDKDFAAHFLVFLIREIEANLNELKNESFLSYQKWMDYFSPLDPKVYLKDLSPNYFIQTLIEHPIHSTLNVNLTTVKKVFALQQLGFKDHEILEMVPIPDLMTCFPHRFCFAQGSGMLAITDSKVATAQIEWELWGLLSLGRLDKGAQDHIDKLEEFCSTLNLKSQGLTLAFEKANQKRHQIETPDSL